MIDKQPKPRVMRSTRPEHPLVRWRQERGLTQSAFLARLKKHLPRRGAVVSKPTLSRIESGVARSIAPGLLQAILAATAGAIQARELPPARPF